MNIAIIIGVSEYNNAPNLPSCKVDSEIINSIIESSRKYDEILFINDNTQSSFINDSIVSFIERIRLIGDKTEEVFFYFSGHGLFADNEFYYILSDFNDQKRNQTALKNSYVDDLVRTLNSDLFVKIIDFCQSGNHYIKSHDFLVKYLDNTKSAFKKCYFMSSSAQDQYSYASQNISHFTESLVKSIKFLNRRAIRYTDIINYISDDFINNINQTPLFVTQANHTELFIERNEELLKSLNDQQPPEMTTSTYENPTINKTLLSAIAENAKNYITKDQALDLFDDIKECVVNFEFTIADLYDISVNFHKNYDEVAKKEDIINWLKNNPNNFFIKKTTSYQRKADLPKLNPFTTIAPPLRTTNKPKFSQGI